MGAGLNATATGTLLLSEVRQALATVLAPAADSDPEVLADLVDAFEPPVLMVEWSDPWLTPRTVGGSLGYYDAHLNVLCIAGRLEPGPGIATLEELLAYAIARTAGDFRSWPVESSTAPRRFEMAGVSYLGARLSLLVPVAIE